MASVYEATHKRLGNRVAIKVMNPTLLAQPLASARFVREATVAAQIRHQNVVRVFDIGAEGGVPFIVMDLVEGVDLAALLREEGPLPLARIVEILLPVLDAIGSAHERGIIHRDLKPANLMLAACAHSGVHPIVLDFGISKVVDEPTDAALTTSQALLGTLQYMAPELTRGARFATAASDQYALGVILYECATGRRPFSGDNSYDLMHAIVTHLVIPPSRIRRDLPPEFDAIVQRAMSRDPSARFPSVHALGGALLSFADRRAWTLWQSKFLGTDENDCARGATVVTAIEPEVPERASPSHIRPLDRKIASSRPSLVGAHAVAATLTLLITLAWSFTRRDAPRGSPIDDGLAAVATTAPQAVLTAPQAVVTTASLDAPPRNSTLSSALVQPLLSPVRAASEPRAAEPSVAHGERVRTPAAAPLTERIKNRPRIRREPTARGDSDMGSNGAPILE